MLKMAFSGLYAEPQWSKEEVQWYMLSQNTVTDKSRKVAAKPVQAGCIFKINYEESKLNSDKNEIILQSCNKGKIRVRWAPNLFYGLDEDTKDFLLAVEDYPERLRLYKECQEVLLYAKQLKVGDKVYVQFPKQNHYHVSGKVKYIGTIDSKCSAKYVGVELQTKCGNTDGKGKSGKYYFHCEEGRGAFVAVNNLVPPPLMDKKKNNASRMEKEEPPTRNQADDLGITDAPQPQYLKKGDRVLVSTKMDKGCHFKQVLGTVVFIHAEHVGVEVDKEAGKPLIPWNGYHRGERLYHTPSQQTVFVERENVSPSDLQLTQSSSSAKSQANLDYAGAVKGTKSNMNSSAVSSSEGGLLSDENRICIRELQSNTAKTKNLYKTGDVHTDQPLPSGLASMESDFSMSDSRVSSLSRVEGLQSHSEKSDERCHSLSGSFNTCEDRSLPSVNGTKEKSSWKNFLSFSRANPPQFPFSMYVAEVLSKYPDVFMELVSDLRMNQDWNSICKKEKDNYIRVDFLLKKWWSNIPEKHKAEQTRFLHLLAKHGLDDLRDYIIEVPDFGSFHETVVFMLTSLVGNKVEKFAFALGLSANEVKERINQHMPHYEATKNVMQFWQNKENGSKKLATVIKACRTIDLDDLAGDIEQGLSEEVLKKISRKIEHRNWENFGSHIGVTYIRRDAFSKKFTFLTDRVYHMLCWWSMKLPLNTDKAARLSDALGACNHGSIAAEELNRGISDNDLETAACLIGDQWKTVAAVLVTSRDVDYLTKYKGDAEKALHLLKIWKRRQPLTAKNLKKALYSHLMNLDMYRAARQLYDGLDDGTVTRLSRKLCFDWPVLAHSFGYSHHEISKRLQTSNHIDMTLIVLKEWLHANEGNSTEETKAKLRTGLIAIGREDLVEWMQRRVEEDVEERLEKPADGTHDHTSQFRKLDIINLKEVANAIGHLSPNFLMEMLHFSSQDLKKFLPTNVHMDESKPHFAILCSWKRKMMRSGSGELDCIEFLIHVLKTYDEDKAAAILTDGTSVDPASFGSQGGAIGGASAPSNQTLNVYSMVEVTWGGKVLPGLIQWIGVIRGLEEHGKIAGVELEDFAEVGAGSGKFGDTRYFDCQYGRGLFIPLSRCRPDSRFLTETETYASKEKMEKEDFGDIDCDPVEGYVKPSETVKPEHIGMFKGIQGDHNSCYMDVTLYSMFAFSDIFDAILHYDDTAKTETKNVKDALRETIVNPLRKIGVVRADHVLRFRDLLSLLSSMEGFRTEEKDPEEFIHALLQELLNAKPFLKISQGKNETMESFVYQIFTDKKEYLDIPTVEDLLHVSFLESDLKLSEVPDCFIVQLPRYGKKYKLYDWIIPSLEMNISLLIKKSPRPCSSCGKLAFMECRDCTPEYEDDDIIQSFCGECYQAVHQPKSKRNHQNYPLPIEKEFVNKYLEIATKLDEEQVATETEHLYEKKVMELFSVVCIETSHYVAFVKTGSGEHARWVFFDSMADRRGDQHGYNVPEVSHLRDFETQMRRADLKDALKGNEELPKYLKRLLSDAYICFYRPTQSGSDISWRGRTRKSLDGVREQNVSGSRGVTVSTGTNLSQQKYEKFQKHSDQSYSGGHYSNFGNIEETHERPDPSRTENLSQKTARERHREGTQDHVSPRVSSYNTSSPPRYMGSNPSYPRSDAVSEEHLRNVESNEHHHFHHHQSGVVGSSCPADIPMETNNTNDEVWITSNPGDCQVSGGHNAFPDKPSRTTIGTNTRNTGSGVGQRRTEGDSRREWQPDHTHHTQAGVMHASVNQPDEPMDVDEPGKHPRETDHRQHQSERKKYGYSYVLEDEKHPRNKKLYTPDAIKEGNAHPGFTSHVHINLTQNQRRDDNDLLQSDEGSPDKDSLGSFEVIKPEDTSLVNTRDAQFSEQSHQHGGSYV